jgi:hypothetical protein
MCVFFPTLLNRAPVTPEALAKVLMAALLLVIARNLRKRHHARPVGKLITNHYSLFGLVSDSVQN